jgi:RES domain
MIEQRRRSLSDISISDLRSRIASLRRADLEKLSTEGAAYRIGRIIDQYPFHIRTLALNGLYRARANNPGEVFSSALQLWHPPADKVLRPSRLNGPGQVRFYASDAPNTAILELRPHPGNVFTVLLARTRSRKIETLNVAFIGLERSRAPEVRNLRDSAPRFRDQLGPANYKKWLLVDDYLSEIFGTSVPEGEEYRYKPTIALANLLFAAPDLDAVNYPSVATSDHGINICMLPDKANQFFTALEAWMIKVEENALHPKTGKRLQRIRFLNRSHEIGPDGAIVWRPPGEDIKPDEIMRFVRGRMQSLDQWPLAVKS